MLEDMHYFLLGALSILVPLIVYAWWLLRATAALRRS